MSEVTVTPIDEGVIPDGADATINTPEIVAQPEATQNEHIEPIEQGLTPSDVVPDMKIEQFDTDVPQYEVHNLKIGLSETEQGADVLIGLKNNGNIFTQELGEEAIALGASKEQVTAHNAYVVQEVNKVYQDANMSFEDGNYIMGRVHNEFTPEELSILDDEWTKSPKDALIGLKEYFSNED